jgi:cysteine desulfuration protein SufE
MAITRKQEEIVEEFMMFDDWSDRYEHLIEIGKECPLIEDSHKTDDRLIRGCQSRVWLHAEKTPEGTILFSADSDAIITKGLISLMIRVLNNERPEDIARAELTFIDRIGLKEHLSPTRSNGLVNMVTRMKLYGVEMSS